MDNLDGELEDSEKAATSMSTPERLAQLRDEVRLKLHLGGAEARDLFERLEHKWKDYQARLKPARAATKETAHDVWAALKQVAEELFEGYQRIKNALKEGR